MGHGGRLAEESRLSLRPCRSGSNSAAEGKSVPFLGRRGGQDTGRSPWVCGTFGVRGRV